MNGLGHVHINWYNKTKIKGQILESLRLSFAKTDLKSPNSPEILANVREWLKLPIPHSELNNKVNNSNTELNNEVKNLVEKLGEHKGFRGWSIFNGTDFSKTLTNHMKAMLKEFLNYNELFTLYNECKSMHTPSKNQSAFMKYVDEIREELKNSPEYKSDSLRKTLLKNLNEKEGSEWDQKLKNLSFGMLNSTEEKEIKEKVINEVLSLRKHIDRNNVNDQLNDFIKISRTLKQVSPSIVLQQRQQDEKKIFKQWQSAFKILNEDEIKSKYLDLNEFNYCLAFLNNFDQETIKKFNFNSELFTLIKSAIDQNITITLVDEVNNLQIKMQKEMNNSDAASGERLLLLEIFSILRQFISINLDNSNFRNQKHKFYDLNTSIILNLQEIKKSLESRFISINQYISKENSVEIKTLINNLDALSITTNEDIAYYFQSLNAILEKIHTYEKIYIQKVIPEKGKEFLNLRLDSPTIDLDKKIIEIIIQDPVRKTFVSMHTSSERNEIRLKEMAKNLILEVIQQSPEGLILSKMLELEPIINPINDKKSPTDKLVQDANQRAVNALLEDNYAVLREKVISKSEHAFKTYVDKEVKNEEDLTSTVFYEKLKLNAIEKWFAELQEIWIKALPYDQEQEIAEISDKIKQQEKMSTYFEAWMSEKAGIPFKTEGLVFTQIQIRNRKNLYTPQNQEALRKLLLSYKEKKENRFIAQVAANNEQVVKHGFEMQLMRNDIPVPIANAQEQLELSFLSVNVSENILAEHNFVYLKNHPYPTGIYVDNLNKKLEWVEKAFHELQQPISSSISTYFYACYIDTITSILSSKSKIPMNFLFNFLHVSFSKEWGVSVFESDNTSRKQFLNLYLNIICSEPITVTENEKKYIIQFCHLTERELPQISVDNNRKNEYYIEDIGYKLQNSQIGLEGLNESEIQLAFQASRGLVDEPNTRTYIDFLRARSNPELALELFPYVLRECKLIENNNEKISPQDWERASRAVITALAKKSPEEVKNFFDEYFSKIDLQNIEIDPNTLTPPLSIFIADIMLHLFPESANSSQYKDIIRQFNEKLILSKDANYLMVGYAREICRLTQIQITPPSTILTSSPSFSSDISIASSTSINTSPSSNINTTPITSINTTPSSSPRISTPSLLSSSQVQSQKDEMQDNFALLLKMKMAYQSLKKEHFRSDDKIHGFLKLFADQANQAIIKSALDIEYFIKEYSSPEYLNEIALKIIDKKTDQAKKHADNVAYDVFKAQQHEKIEINHTPPIFISFGNIDINFVNGTVYHNGYNCDVMPLHMQNHPYIRSLQLHNLQYVNSNGTYCYYSGNENEKILKVLIALDANDKVVIQKMLPNNFKDTRRLKLLQFLPVEQHAQIPAALSQRLGIEHFWYDENKRIYGYDKSGALVAKIKKNNDGIWSITTKNHKYIISKNEEYLFPAHLESRNEVLQQLLKFVPREEILIGREYKSFFIPAIDLKIKLDSLSPLNRTWICEGKDIANMVIDINAENNEPYLVLKEKIKEEPPSHLKRKLKNLNEELKTKQSIAGSSLAVKYEIGKLQKKIAKLNSTISQYDKKLYLVANSGSESHQIYYEGMSDTIKNLENEYKNLMDPQSALSPEERALNLKNCYAESTKRYTEQEAAYRESCHALQAFYFASAQDDCVIPHDLKGCLYLLQNAMKNNSHMDHSIAELAKHPFSKPLDSRTFELLSKLKDNCEKNRDLKKLTLYLMLLICQHSLLEMEEGLQSNSDDLATIEKLRANFKENQKVCNDFLTKNNLDKKDFPSELLILVHKFCSDYFHNKADEPSQQVPNIPFLNFPEISAKKLQRWSHESLLNRFSEVNSIIAKKKEINSYISTGQSELINEFKSHSKEQVDGFYLEEFGRFNADSLCTKLAVSPSQDGRKNGEDKGLFGVTRQQLEKIIEELYLANVICLEGGLYSIALDKNPQIIFQTNAILPLLSNYSLSTAHKKQIAEKLSNFFLQAANAASLFSYKNAASEKIIDAKLHAEKEIHISEMLSAEYFLKSNYSNYSIAECKRAVLTGIYPNTMENKQCAALRNALIRYLFHKTEVQHIENIFKAPMVGERNKIELLNNRRQYNIDLIFKEDLKDSARVEKIIQLAFMLFEEDYGYRCNASQVELFRALMLPNNSSESIDAIQARMGFGKTALLPLMALVRIAVESAETKNNKSLIRYVVPKSVIEDNATSFNKQLYKILGSNVIKDKDFSRYQLGEDKVESFYYILEDLRQRLSFYKAAREQGVVLIQWPEIRQSMEAQELAFAYLILEENKELNDYEKDLCLKCKQVLGQIRSMTTYTVFDELDATQDFKSCEVNFTEGEKTPIEKESIDPLISLIQCVQNNGILNNNELAKRMLTSINVEYNDDFIKRLLDKQNEISLHVSCNNLNKMQGILLSRAILLDPNILAFITSKQANTHFGVRFKLNDAGQRVYYNDVLSKSPLLIAVPYEGTNTPKGMSLFDNTEVAAIATIRYYMSKETILEKNPHLDFLLSQAQQWKQAGHRKLPDEFTNYVANVNDSNGQSFLKRLNLLSSLEDKSEIALAKERFYEDFLKHPHDDLRKYFGAVVVATQVRSDAARANSDRYEMNSLNDTIRGCSGTIGSTSSYFERQKNDPASDGKMSLEIMARDNNAQVCHLPPSAHGEEYLTSTLSSILNHAKLDTRAIIDAAGICKSPDGTPEKIVEQLWKLLEVRNDSLSKIQGIVYYGLDNVKRLYRGKNEPSIPCTTAMELEALSGKKYFSFYGQKNTRGSDIKQAHGAHALVTMDENVTNSDAKQAILRFRELVNRNSEQTFSFVLTNEFNITLSNKYNGVVIDAKYIAKYLRETEMLHEEHDSLIIFNKELGAHVKQAATYIEHSLFGNLKLNRYINSIYKDFLQECNEISSFVEISITTAMEKYDQGLSVVDKVGYIDQQTRFTKEKIKILFELRKHYLQKIQDVNADLEYKEDEKEIGESKLSKNLIKIDDNNSIDFSKFNKRVDRSAEIFSSRYKQKTVHVPKTNSVAISIAQAQAQAQSLALAENFVESLNVKEIHSTPALVRPSVQMSANENFEINKNWLQHPTGRTVINSWLYNLIHPDYRGNILVSPHLLDKNIVSHFILKPQANSLPYDKYIFISQDEADALRKHYKNNYEFSHFELCDLRDLVTEYDDPILKSMKASVLNDVSLPDPAQLTTTNILRALNTATVDSKKFLPHLLVISGSNEILKKYIEFSKFAVRQTTKSPIKMSIQQRNNNQVCLTVENYSVNVLINNTWFKNAIQSVYSLQQPISCKINQAYNVFSKNAEQTRQKKKDLEEKNKQLEIKKAEAENVIRNTSGFNFTETMRHNLRAVIKDKAIEFIAKANEIAQKQQNFNQYKNETSLVALLRCFGEFVSEKLLNSAANSGLTQDQLSYFHSFDNVYKIILHDYHSGNYQTAMTCSYEICKTMFTTILPNIKEAVKGIKIAAEKLPPLWNEIEKNQQEIDKIKLELDAIEEAEMCFKNLLNMQVLIESVLKRHGLSLSTEGEFFDMFHFERFSELAIDKAVEVSLEGMLPDYTNVVKSFEEYKSNITACSQKESDTLEHHYSILKRVIELAAQLEIRKSEIKEIDF